jgi:chromosome segregation ATPase
MSDEMAQINVRVPERTKELAKNELGHGGLTQLVRKEMERVAHGGDVTEKNRIQDRLEKLRDERQELKTERNQINDRLDDVERKIERAESELDAIRNKEGEYEGALQVIEDQMHEKGMRVWEGHGQVEDVALLGDCDPVDVVADLKERNPDLPKEQFEMGSPAKAH